MTDLDLDPPADAPANAPTDAPVGVIPPEPVAPAHPPRFPAFDGLRAIAAGTVVGVHTAFVSGVTLRKPYIGIYTARLEIGVAVFFLISGFLLYRPFAVAHLAGGPRPRTGAFWLRRLLRIVPGFWVALFVSTTILHAESIGPGGWTAYASHYLFLQIYFIPQALKGISQAWSLDVEMSFYLLLPIYAAVLGRRRAAGTPATRLRRELLGLGVLVAIGMAWRIWDLSLQTHGHVYELMSIWLPAELDLFAAGMLLAILSAWTHQHGRELALCSRWWFPWASWLAAAAAYFGVCHLGISISVSYVKTELDIARQTLYGAFAFFLLLPAVFGPARKGAIRKFLCSWPMRAMGVISYGIYLWHQSLIEELQKHYRQLFGQKLFFDVAFWGMFGEILGAAIVVATVSYFVVEKPALRLKGLLGWFRQAPPGAAHAAGRRPASTA